MIRSRCWSLYLPPDDEGEEPIFFSSFSFLGELTKKEAIPHITSGYRKLRPWHKKLPKGCIVEPGELE